MAAEDADNVYLTEFVSQPAHAPQARDFFTWLQQPSGHSSFERRRTSVRRYAFGVPNRAALEAIAACSPIVELGAGTGYWAYLLEARGVDIVAYDLAPPDSMPNAYLFDPRTWTSVRRGGVEILEQYAERTLFLCWPGYKDDFADQALAAYPGQRLIYVGESAGGNTANDQFFDRLAREWLPVERVTLPQWPGARDALEIYTRQPVG